MKKIQANNPAAILTRKCHVRIMVHGECTSYFERVYLLYQPAAVELHFKIITCRHLRIIKEACKYARGS